MATLHAELVSVERPLWSGEATEVQARTTEGEIGILPGHAPLLAELAAGWLVRIGQESGDDLIYAVHGGFLSVTGDGVSILAEQAELSTEIDVSRAHDALERAQGSDDPEAVGARDRAMSRLRASGQAV